MRHCAATSQTSSPCHIGCGFAWPSWVRARRAGAPFAFALVLLLAAVAIVFALLRLGKLTFSSAGDLAVAVTAVITSTWRPLGRSLGGGEVPIVGLGARGAAV